LKPEINYRNLEELALRFHKEHSVASDQLKDTLAAMAAAGWRFCNAIEERGLPSRYYAQFTAAVRGGTIYTPEYFEQMRVDQLVETRGRPRKRARAVEASPCEAEAAKPEEHEHQEDKENKERRAQASAAAAARAMLAVRAAWGQKNNSGPVLSGLQTPDSNPVWNDPDTDQLTDTVPVKPVTCIR
jgi:hypothetical protein